MTNTELKTSIMKRVHRIYVLRKFFNPMMYRLYLSVIFLGGVVSFVSISNVAANVPKYGSVSDIYDFIVSAFTHTELAVQILTVGASLTMVWFVIDIAKTLVASQIRAISA